MKKIIGFILIGLGVVHGLGTVVGLSKGHSPLPLLFSAGFVIGGVFLIKSAKKTNN